MRSKTDCVAEPADDGDGEVLALSQRPSAGRQPSARTRRRREQNDRAAGLAHARRAAETPALRTVTPSSAEDDDGAAPAGAGGRAAALLRGSLAHRLLQSLPDIPAERRAQGGAGLSRPRRRRT